MSCCEKLLRGAGGLAKAALGVDRASEAQTQRRRDLCRACPHATRSPDPRFAATLGLTSLSRCTRCSCILSAKTRIQSERCPEGRW